MLLHLVVMTEVPRTVHQQNKITDPIKTAGRCQRFRSAMQESLEATWGMDGFIAKRVAMKCKEAWLVEVDTDTMVKIQMWL